MGLLDRVLYQNTLYEWLVALGAATAAFLVLRVLVGVIRGRLTRLAGVTQNQLDDIVVAVLSRTKSLTLVVLSVYLAIHLLTLPARLTSATRLLAILVFLVQCGIWINTGLGTVLQRYILKGSAQDRGAATTIGAVGFVAKGLVWTVLLLVALDNVGVNITTLVAGLGVGGVAVALATQNILGDLFASLSIVLDKPFVLGDFVIVDDMQGTVEHIGLKTTRLRSIWGEQVVFSNTDLLKSRLRNFGRMAERRIVFKIGVTYDTPRVKLERIPDILKDAINEQKLVRFDRSHFAGFGEFALAFEGVYYVLVPEYQTYMDIQQAINLRILEAFEHEEIEFAYPTRTLQVRRSRRRHAETAGSIV
jgi:small-conductance mechanosensitive channel